MAAWFQAENTGYVGSCLLPFLLMAGLTEAGIYGSCPSQGTSFLHCCLLFSAGHHPYKLCMDKSKDVSALGEKKECIIF